MSNEEQPMWYQYNGCPAHCSAVVREFLDNVFPRNWIERYGEIHKPARSPDLIPNDFFLSLRSKLYPLPTHSILDLLKDKITEVTMF
ncbi:hypothetical protein ILUMI_26069 [Ignelater luminosus]|uniref:Uncharacterized protein n=1 Tax=Ignelater luminosus TaxID=2038154 RepID=A0A8K0C775_IGNLU|nr:hypothetical protein ILUMI_26069 [Ignelater luminosus]